MTRMISFLFERFFYNPQGQESATNSVKTAIDVVVQYFQAHLANEITIAEIADMVNFNVSFLSREFKKVRGILPIEYLTQFRIDKAKQLIVEPAKHKD
ncbi:AraC family transcriptional regulator [Paenibacillus marchantiophytorum]|uniref:AraC family transcriptional regulator n=1 Tax=Paenibacillus marchantiophytorum TaxID=1619310 RepID=UPI0016653AA3|nr:AraC family transcriptional regulator [Paenibacillus marchantiophytorum]